MGLVEKIRVQRHFIFQGISDQCANAGLDSPALLNLQSQDQSGKKRVFGQLIDHFFERVQSGQISLNRKKFLLFNIFGFYKLFHLIQKLDYDFRVLVRL